MVPKIQRYLENVTPQRPAILREMEQYASEKHFPIVGPLVGRLLYQLALVSKAKRIMELGSGYGYSAYWFSLALRSKGEILLTDTSKQNKRLAMSFFQKAGLESHFTYRVGDALETLKKQDGQFDIVFNDIDKKDYPKTIDLVAPRLKKGGLFITDNLIWDGKVAEKKPDETTAAIIDFTKELYRDSRFFTTIMPIRDGVAVAVRV